MTDELSARRKRRRPSILCQALSKQTGEPCQLPPAPGQKVCRFHGGYARTRDKVARARIEPKLRRRIPPPEEWRHLDPLEAADAYRAEADAWLAVLRTEVAKLESFEVTVSLNLGDGKAIEKIGAEIRAVVALYVQAMRTCFDMAATAVKLGIQERYVDQLERQSELFARVLAEGMRLLAIDVPPERYSVVIPQAIAAVQAESVG